MLTAAKSVSLLEPLPLPPAFPLLPLELKEYLEEEVPLFSIQNEIQGQT